MGIRARALTGMAITAMLAPVLLFSAAACGTVQACGGQCGPPFQLQVTFRPGVSKQAATAAMRKCQADPLVISIGQPYRSRSPGTPIQWTAIIYTKRMLFGPKPVPLLTCLRHSPTVTSAGWPD